MSQWFCTSNLCAVSKPCHSPRNTPPDFAGAKLFLPALTGNHFRCGKQGMMYLLDRSRRPRLLRPARFKERGGRANRRRCARWRRFPSDCRIETHSNMRTVVLCRNFSSGTLCLARFEQERYAPASRESPRGRSVRAGYKDGLRSAAERLGDFEFQASPTEIETYEE